jgi:chorismate synthase
MSHNTFGHLFRVTTWGESHGPAIGAIVDGCPPGIALSEADIQPFLDQRRPGTSRFVTQRQEPDAVKILSGVHQGRTTGTPISLMIENIDARSKDYAAIADAFRPGHADWAYQEKYGLRDPRGGGRSSARETACRVAAGAIARKVIAGVAIRAAVIQIGPHKISGETWDWAQCEANPFFAPDPAIVPVWEAFLDETRKAGSSAGAIVEVRASGAPAAWGAPLYAKLDAEIAAALMSINAVKGVEIGDGFAVAALRGEDNGDQMRAGHAGAHFESNHAGGILGGISTGQDIIARIAIKPTSSILTPMRTITADGEETDILTKGRHDPCVGIRAAPVAEAMLACVLADAMLRDRGQTGRQRETTS